MPRHEVNGVNMRQSISELDSLLDDLNQAQRVGFSNSGVNRHEIITTESNMYVMSLYFIRIYFANDVGTHLIILPVLNHSQ